MFTQHLHALFTRGTLITALALAASTAPIALLGQKATAADDEAVYSIAGERKLVVDVDDLQARADISSEFVRKDILRAAFHRAAKRNQWLGDYDFSYNRNISEEKSGRLEFNVLDWERTRTGMYEFTASARYHTLHGEEINLGVIHGLRSGIDVMTGWDVGDHFMEAAQDAFSEALKRLAKKSAAA